MSQFYIKFVFAITFESYMYDIYFKSISFKEKVLFYLKSKVELIDYYKSSLIIKLLKKPLKSKLFFLRTIPRFNVSATIPHLRNSKH